MTHPDADDAALIALAEQAGLLVHWDDARGKPQTVAPAALRTLLAALGLPADDDDSVQASREELTAAQGGATPALVIATVNTPIVITGVDAGPYTLFRRADGGKAVRNSVNPDDAPNHATSHADADADGVRATADDKPDADVDADADVDSENDTALFSSTDAGLFADSEANLFASSEGGLFDDSAATHSVKIAEGRAERTADGAIQLAPVAEPGYYVAHIGDAEVAIAVAPTHCPSVAERLTHPKARAWGPAAQVYSLRQADASASGGFGDFTALTELAAAAAERGAEALAISPVHAMFGADPSRYSPYSPSSRLLLNGLFADPARQFGQEAVRQAVADLGLTDTLAELDARDQIDWPAAGAARWRVLRHLFDGWIDSPHDARHDAFDTFRERGGEALERHAIFEAIQSERAQAGEPLPWQHWPDALRDPASRAVAAFARDHARDVTFFAFAQWLAADGLAAAQSCARERGMGIGLIADLAVGTDPGGSHAWSRQEDVLQGLSPGAPPDVYNPLGQNWGLTAFSPVAMHANGYAAFIEMLRAVLEHAGGIRIDHVLGLQRTWLVPKGADAGDGAYLRYPIDDMLRLIALEAWRHDAIVVGENLGTVPDGFNERIARAGMLGMTVLWFERDEDGAFIPATQWSDAAMAMTTTHDLPTIPGWWRGRDIEWRAKLNLFGPNDTESAQRETREADKQALRAALESTGALLRHPPADALDSPPVAAILEFTSQGPAPLVVVPLEDLLALNEQPNIPGTIDEHPNWVQRLPVAALTLFDATDVQDRVAAIHQARSQS
ncbi:4-alpha-glucanotransferase [Alcaligenaceae bacterium A4P071]|nr:4-alpha-glucanotransferase [Alcaligenaceae bacterium A4P071]